MSFIDRPKALGRQGAEEDNGSLWSGMKSAWWLGSGLLIAALLAPTALSDTLDVTDTQKTEVEHEEANQLSWQREVHPRFAFDGQLFDIEPSAPPRDAERQSCYPAVDEELGPMCSE